MEVTTKSEWRDLSATASGVRTAQPDPKPNTGRKMFEPLRKDPAQLRSQIIVQLRSAIATGVLLPGQNLGEQALCQQLGVSRTTLREALRCLESEKLVGAGGNGRMSVLEVNATDAEKIYELLAVLTAEALNDFSKPRGLEQLRNMRLLLKELESAAVKADTPALAALLARFYEVFSALFQNTVISEIFGNLLARTGYLRRESLASKKRRKTVLDELRTLLIALEQGSIEAAQKAVASHFKLESVAALQVLSRV